MTSRTVYSATTPEASQFALSSHVNQDSVDADEDLNLDAHNDVADFRSKGKDYFLRVLSFVKNNAGLLLVSVSQFFFSLMNLAVKKLSVSIDPPVPALELVVVRMGITWIFCVAYMYITKVPDPFLGPKGVRLLLLLRGFSGFFGLFGVYYSLQYLSLSDATVLTFLSPITTAIVGWLMLNESFTLKEALSGFFSLIGVILIARPAIIFGEASRPQGTDMEKGTPAERLGAVGIALVGVLGATGAYTTLRAIGKRAHPLHSVVAFSTLCVIVASSAMIGTRTRVVIPKQFSFVVLLIMIGVFGFIGQTLLAMGLQRETAGRSAMAMYLQIVFATVLERMFFHSSPSVLSIIGTLIIMASAIFVALNKTSNATGTNSSTRVSSVALEGVEEAAMEEGLLEHMESSEVDDHDDDAVPIKPVDKSRSSASGHESTTDYGDIELVPQINGSVSKADLG